MFQWVIYAVLFMAYLMTFHIYWVGTERPDGSDMRMPVDRMPFGMIEHCINFFNADDIHQVQVVLPLL